MSDTVGAFADQHERLLEEASARVELEDFGPSDFREGYDRLLDDLDGAGLTEGGKFAARELILGNLVSRLRAVAEFKKYPEAMERPITRPLVVTGIVRSGTTALHKLLSMDKQFQGPENWLTSAPQPRPPRAEWPSNPDYQRAKAHLDAMIEVVPELFEDHGMSVDDVEESLNILAHSFCSNMYPSQFYIPNYDQWYWATDDTFSYRYFANVLRVIGANDPHRTWLLKNPTDTYSLQQVLNVFPDAMIVQTHRDPLQSIPSIVNLLVAIKRMFQGEHVDVRQTFMREQVTWANAMQRADEVKDGLDPSSYFDIRFDAFVKDQLGTIAKIYDHFDLTLSVETERAMRTWLDQNPRRSNTMQRFTPEQFGCQTEPLLDLYADYREKYCN